MRAWDVSEEETHSDHNLIIIKILPRRTKTNLWRQTVETTKKFATKVGMWNLFKQEVQQINENWKALIKDSNEKGQLEITITTIWKELGDISKTCFPPYQPTSRYVPWWTQSLNTLRKQVNAAKRRLKRCQNQTLKEIYNLRFRNLKHTYKTELIKAKQESGNKFAPRALKLHPGKCIKFAKLASRENQFLQH